MKRRITLIICIVLATSSACTTQQYFSSKQTPIDEVIVGYKRALVMAQEKSIFEEFVKYKELHSTFALYSVAEVTLESSTNISKSSSEKGEASIKFTLEGGVGVSKTIEVGDEQGSTITLKLLPIGNSPETYKAIKNVFDNTAGLNAIYGIAYYDESDKPNLEKAKEKCQASMYCIPMNGLLNSSKNKAFVYLESYTEFRKLMNAIRELKVVEEKTAK